MRYSATLAEECKLTMAPERPTHSDPARSTRLRVPVLMSSSSSTVFSFMKIFSVNMEWLLHEAEALSYQIALKN